MAYKNRVNIEDSLGNVINPAVENGNLASILTEVQTIKNKQENLFIKFILVIQALLKPAWFDATLQRLRETAIIESGTVTTVATVAGLTNIDSYQGKLLVINQNIAAWALVCRTRIT